MEQKIILHFFHLIALHFFLNCYGKIYHFENICVHNNQKRSSETQLSRQNLDLKLSFTTFLWFYNKKPPEQLNMAKNLGHSQEKDWLENSYVVWIYDIVPFFPVPNEQFHNVPDDFILNLSTVPEISLSHIQMGLYLSWELLISGYRD